MRRKLSFRLKLFLNFSIIFAVFTALVLILQFERERNFRRSTFEVTLDNIAELSYNYYRNEASYQEKGYWMIDSLTARFTDLDIRVTIISREGDVVFDSEVENVKDMENHLLRPEVQDAIRSGKGSNIRESETTGFSYYYYVRAYPDYFVRAAAIYDVQVQESLHVERVFFAFLALLFIVVSLVLMFFTRRISETITKLKDFAIRLSSGKEPPENLEFPEDDLGEISSQITAIYRDLNKAQQEILNDQDKLFTHLNTLNEGIAFFTPEKKKILTNQQFIQNLNLVSGQSSLSPEEIFDLPEMAPFVKFIDQTIASSGTIKGENLPGMVEVMERSKRFFRVSCMFFTDRSFEMVISDTTPLEKRKRITQQMTSNISHELKTPVTSILGYLETLQEGNVPEKTRKQFLKRALRQTERLWVLIEDLSSLNKIEEASDSYQMEKVRIRKIVDEVHQHMQLKQDAKKIRVSINIPKNMEIEGSVSLLFSVFYNLFDNVIKYGGEGITIKLDNYLEDRKYYYFSFSNSGNVVDEKHLTRIFERFYRIDKGRSRDEGGTGLGLSIVKNAIELHGGSITAKSLDNGGLEFLFTLSK
jgi:two-component system, OmpR family, phosphate regulon sensor histidine kinase PhoR